MLRKNKSNPKLVGAITILLTLAVIIWWQISTRKGTSPDLVLKHTPAGPQEKLQAQLYFSSLNTKKLIPEKRLIIKAVLFESQAKSVIKELILGPKQSSLQPTIPPDSHLREFYIDEKGCAYLDFDAEIKRNHPGGSYAELMTIASLVKTLTANFNKIKQVKLLINGAEIETLAGHIDTRFPFSPQDLSLSGNEI